MAAPPGTEAHRPHDPGLRAGSAAIARGLPALLTLSGALALVYQSLWVRQLSLVLGSTTYAIGTVLAAFMAGLGIGAWVLGLVVDRRSDSLRLYAWLELTIGILGFLSPLVLVQSGAIYALAYDRVHDSPALLTLARFAIGFTFVTAPAFLMGGTLPVATRVLVSRDGDVGRQIGRLYALNTLGAAAGSLLLPFVLLPALGVRRTLLAAALGNVAISAAAWAWAPREPTRTGAVSRGRPALVSRPSVGLLAALFLSGFVALALEVVWNRFFVNYVGSSIYGYAVVLFLYLTGVVIGGALFTVLDRRGHDPVGVFVACLFLLVADLTATIPAMDRIVYLQLVTLDAFGTSFGAFQLASAVAAFLVILPPTILLGISFPAVAHALSPRQEVVGRRLGLAYLVNAAGTTAGALAASFLLLPRLGLRPSLDVLVLVAAVALLLAAGRRLASGRGLVVGVVTAALLLGVAVTPSWDTRLMHVAVSKDAEAALKAWREDGLESDIAATSVLALRDGVDATVSIVEYAGSSRVLFVNGKPDASDDADMPTQMILGHLPMLVHPSPARVLMIGMGSGVSLAAVARHPARTIDLVELSPEVLDLSGHWFASVNHDVLSDPRVTVHVEDGRNLVAFGNGEPYDVIISEPSNPWMTGAASLFTDEFFGQVQRRLRSDGVLAQWFHYYSMDVQDVRALLGALRRHFSYVYVFALHPAQLRGDIIIVASQGAVDFTPALAALASDDTAGQDLEALGIGPMQLLQAFVLSRENVDAFVGDAAPNSDDRPVVELHAPRALFHDTVEANLEAMHRGSGGARLPVSGGEAFAHSFAVGAPTGFHRTAAAFRNTLAPPTSPGGRPLRALLTEVTFENDAGARLVVLGEHGPADDDGAERLAREAANVDVRPAGQASVAGHSAVSYGRSDGQARTLVWSCWETGDSYAASLVPPAGRDGGLPADVLEEVRCHEDR